MTRLARRDVPTVGGPMTRTGTTGSPLSVDVRDHAANSSGSATSWDDLS